MIIFPLNLQTITIRVRADPVKCLAGSWDTKSIAFYYIGLESMAGHPESVSGATQSRKHSTVHISGGATPR